MLSIRLFDKFVHIPRLGVRRAPIFVALRFISVVCACYFIGKARV